MGGQILNSTQNKHFKMLTNGETCVRFPGSFYHKTSSTFCQVCEKMYNNILSIKRSQSQ